MNPGERHLNKGYQHLAPTVETQRGVVQRLAHQYPVRQLCRGLGGARSRYYYQALRCDEGALKAAIERLAAAWPTDGYRRITARLHREHLQVNHTHVARLMGEMGRRGQRPGRSPRATQSAHPYPRDRNLVDGLAIVRPDQGWVGDITYIRWRQEFVYLAVLMDVYSRAIRGGHLRRHLDQTRTLSALRRALAQHRPEIHHSDQGGQYAATAYVETLQRVGTHISMATVGEPTENGDAERLMRTIKEEAVTRHEYTAYRDAFQHLGRFLDDVSQHKRMHSALGDLTPAQSERQWQQQQDATTVGKLAPP